MELPESTPRPVDVEYELILKMMVGRHDMPTGELPYKLKMEETEQLWLLTVAWAEEVRQLAYEHVDGCDECSMISTQE